MVENNMEKILFVRKNKNDKTNKNGNKNICSNNKENKKSENNRMKMNFNYFLPLNALRLILISFLFLPTLCFLTSTPSSSSSSSSSYLSKHWSAECSSKHQSSLTFLSQKSVLTSTSTSTFLSMQNYPINTNDHKSPEKKKKEKTNTFFSNNFFSHQFFSKFSKSFIFERKKKAINYKPNISIITESEHFKAILIEEEKIFLTGNNSVTENIIKNENESELNNIKFNNNDDNKIENIPQKNPTVTTSSTTTTTTHKKQSSSSSSQSQPSQPPLISFHTAGNWKNKKRSWLKYKKTTGWQDPYRDGEDYFLNPCWRFFAEIFYPVLGKNKSESVDKSGSKSVSVSGSKRKSDSDSENENGVGNVAKKREVNHKMHNEGDINDDDYDNNDNNNNNNNNNNYNHNDNNYDIIDNNNDNHTLNHNDNNYDTIDNNNDNHTLNHNDNNYDTIDNNNDNHTLNHNDNNKLKFTYLHTQATIITTLHYKVKKIPLLNIIMMNYKSVLLVTLNQKPELFTYGIIIRILNSKQ